MNITRVLSISVILVILFGGCATTNCRTGWDPGFAWSWKEQLQSVEDSSSYSTLVLKKSDVDIYILVDGRAAFRTLEGKQATFKVTPGTHRIQARYIKHAIDGTWQSEVVERLVIIEPSRTFKVYARVTHRGLELIELTEDNGVFTHADMTD